MMSFFVIGIDEHSGHVLNQDYIDSMFGRPGQFENQSLNKNRQRKPPGDKDEINSQSS
jgi:hypothetical protein